MPRDPIKRKVNDLKYRTAHREQRNSYFRKYNVENRAVIGTRKVGKYDQLFGWPAGWIEWALAASLVCALCGQAFDGSQMGGKAVDHNHDTNRFRGVIHNRCNVGIGHLRDSADLCLKAAAYLQAA